MKVYKYSEHLQQLIKSKTKPEPWLHCAVQENDGKKGGIYAIYIWDTRQVVEEGRIPHDVLYDYYTAGYKGKTKRYLSDSKVLGRYARDNGQPLKGAKNKFDFTGKDENDLRPLKITGLKLTGSKFIYDVGAGDAVAVSCVVNGVKAVFIGAAPRFGYKDGIDFVSYEIDGKRGEIFKRGVSSGFWSNNTVLTIHNTTRNPVGKPQVFVGRKYSLQFVPKEFASELIKIYNEHPELFTTTFKNNFNCYK